MITHEHYTIIKDALRELNEAIGLDTARESDLCKTLVDEAILQRFAICQHVIMTALLAQAEKSMGDFDDLESLVENFIQKELVTAHEKESVLTMIKLGYAIAEYSIQYECKRTETVAVVKELLAICTTLIDRMQPWVAEAEKDAPEACAADCCNQENQHTSCGDHCC